MSCGTFDPRSPMKTKFISILIALVATLLVPISPASASGAAWSGTVVTIPAGQAYKGTFDCGEIDNTEAYFDNGVIPPGLTYAGTGVMSGTPTTPGTYELIGFHCTYNGGYGGYLPNANLTFIIQPAVTPTPILVAHSLNTQDCSFYLGFVFPSAPDNGTVYLNIDNGSGNSIRAFADATNQLNGGTVYGGTLTVDDLNNSSEIFGLLLDIKGYRGYQCGDSFNFSVGYQAGGAPVAAAAVDSVVVDRPTVAPVPGSYPTQKLIPLNNDACEFRVLASLPSIAQPNSTHITINVPSQGTDQTTFTISDQISSGMMDFTFSPETLSNGSTNQNGIVSENNQVSTAWACGSPLYVSVDYIDLLGNYWSSTGSPLTNVFEVTPTKPATEPVDNEFLITAGPSELGKCNVSVVVSAPDYARPIGIAITETSSTDWIAGVVIQGQESNNGLIQVNLSFRSKAEIFASVDIEEEDKTLVGTPSCSGTYKAVIDSMGGVLAADIFTLTDSLPTCNAGSILDEELEVCAPVERGFYTTELNSITPIACPAGMTTATTASKSVNDCYKPIAQTIASFKAPKALKFGGTTNLAITTNSKALATYKVTGPCTAKVANITTKVKGKKVITKMLKVTAGKKAGNCSVTLSAQAKDKYLAMSKPVKIKVSKTGK